MSGFTGQEIKSGWGKKLNVKKKIQKIAPFHFIEGQL